jgi:undecaprenyl diphosphate synthase
MSESDQTAKVPEHIGIILDGNRRWARANGLPQLEGHRKGYENLKTIGEAAFNRGVKYLTAFVFSTENWKRSADEVKYLMDLLLWVAKNEVKSMKDKNIRVRFIGSEERLSPKIVRAIKQAEADTKDMIGGQIGLCLNYGGQQELTDATRAIITEGVAADQVTAQTIAEHLYAPDIPPVDLVIRTSGEQRISNFMLWRIAYAEMLFVDKHWPEFNEADLDGAIEWFKSRQRRFGS